MIVGVDPVSLKEIDTVFHFIQTHFRPNFTTHFLYLDARSSSEHSYDDWILAERIPEPSDHDFVSLIMLYHNLGEYTRCNALLEYIEQQKYPMVPSAAMRLAVFKARNM